MKLLKAFWKKKAVPVTHSRRNELPRLLRAGIDRMVAEAIWGAQDEIIEEQVAEYRHRLKERVKNKLDIQVTSALAHVMEMDKAQFNITVNLIGESQP